MLHLRFFFGEIHENKQKSQTLLDQIQTGDTQRNRVLWRWN